MIQRFSKLTIEYKVVCKIAESAIDKYKAIGIMPWHHLIIENDAVFVYIWDTRIIELVLPVDCLNQEDLTYAVIDNKMDLVCTETASETVRKKCIEYKESMPIIWPIEPLTDDERDLLKLEHY